MNISENLPIDTLLLTINAIDNDSGENSRLTYNLIQKYIPPPSLYTHYVNYSHSNQHNNNNNQFRINKDTGEIYLNQLLYAHITPQIEITIEITDNGLPKQITLQTILFNIIDVNNHSPKIYFQSIGCNQFNDQFNEIIISQSIESGSYIGYIIVNDDDIGENSEITCSIHIDNDKDNWLKYSHITINLINNGQINNQYLYTLQILRNNDHSNELLINNQYDRITLSTFTSSIIFLLITCNDNGKPTILTSSISLTIKLVDTKQSIELCFEQTTYELIIEETNQTLMNILRPQLLNVVNSVKFSLQSKNHHHQHDVDADDGCDQLTINAYTGDISALNGIDRERTSLIQCLLIANEYVTMTTKQNYSAYAEIIINITDINDNQPKLMKDILLNGFIINEWDEYNTITNNDQLQFNNTTNHDIIIGYLHSIDEDVNENGTVIYALVNITAEIKKKPIDPHQQQQQHQHHQNVDIQSLFHINSTTGLISLSRNKYPLINWEIIDVYTLQIRIEDMGYPIKLTSLETINIYVNDINDNSPKWYHTIESTSIQLNSMNNIIIYHIKPIWEINSNSPIELSTQLNAYDLDNEDNGKFHMYIIEPIYEYQEFIGNNRLPLPINAIDITSNGNVTLYIDQLEEIYEYYVFIRVQDHGIHRQLYTDGYLLIHLPIQTINKLELHNQHLQHLQHHHSNTNVTISYYDTFNTSQLHIESMHSTWLGLHELRIIGILIISFGLIILLTIIMIIFILFKCHHNNKQRKSLRKFQQNYHNNVNHDKNYTINLDYYDINTMTTTNNKHISSSNGDMSTTLNYKYNPMNVTYYHSSILPIINDYQSNPHHQHHQHQQQNHHQEYSSYDAKRNLNQSTTGSISEFYHSQLMTTNPYSRDQLINNNNEINNCYHNSNDTSQQIIQQSIGYELFYPNNIMTSYNFNENESYNAINTTVTTISSIY